MQNQPQLTPENFILIIDDDPTVSQVLSACLNIPSRLYTSLSGVETLLGQNAPLATFLDIHLGAEENGLTILPEMKKQWPFNPIIVITSDDKDVLLEESFKAGADDFLLKPIRPKEVQARFSTRLTKLQEQAAQTTLAMADITLNLSYRMLSGPLGKRFLAPVETLILAQLIKAQGTLVMKEVVKREAWGVLSVSDNAFYRKVFELRRNLAEVTNSLCIRATYGYGLSLEIQH